MGRTGRLPRTLTNSLAKTSSQLWTFLRYQTCPRTEMRPRRHQSRQARHARDLSPGPDLYCSVACPGKLSRPGWGCTCSHASGGALQGLLTSYWACQAGLHHVSPTACHCSTFSRSGNAVVGPPKAFPNLRGTSSATKESSSCSTSLQAATGELLRASSISFVLARTGLGHHGPQHTSRPSRALWPSPLDPLI